MGRPAGIPTVRASQAPIAGEEWRPVVGYEGIYEVSSEGRIRRVDTGLVMQQVRLRWGYLGGRLSKNGVAKHYRTGIVVAEAFISPRADPAIEVNHKNGIKTDNRAENLEWMSRLENRHHGSVIGVNAMGERHGSHKLTEGQVRAIREDKTWSLRRIAAKYGVSNSTILNVRRRRSWRHVV